MVDNKAAKVDLNSQDFHDDLEAKLEPTLRDVPPKKEVKKPAENKAEEKLTVEDLQKKYDDLIKEKDNISVRYDASSKEGKRLAQEMEDYNKIKDFTPLLSRIGNDEKLQQLIENHIKGETPEEKIDLDEALTSEEAFRKAVSKEAARTVASELDKRLGIERERTDRERKETQRRDDERRFQTEHGLTDEKMEEFKEKMKGVKLTHEHLWQLTMGEELKAKKEQNITNEKLLQLLKTQGLPKSLASLSSREDEVSEVDDIFNSLKKVDTSVEDLLGD